MKELSLRYLGAGLLFSILWASASSAGKFGLRSADGLWLFIVRFLLAGILMLAFVTIIRRERMPAGREWKELVIFGALNTTIYLGIFIVALEFVTAGITSIALALNPLMISLMTALWAKRRVKLIEWVSIVIGMAGVTIASYPLLQSSQATPAGLILLASCMVAYSLGSVYYSAVEWKLSRMSVNGWQVFLGGIMLIPFAFILPTKESHLDFQFWMSVLWLVIPVSIGAVQLWLYLLQADTVKASLWLFLCPIFGLMYAAILLGEPFTIFTGIGTILVLLALLLGQQIWSRAKNG